jgi:hypothetical protein
MNPDFWELKFGVEVSAMYHDWRRATITGYIRFAKTATLLGAIATLVTGILLIIITVPLYVQVLPVVFSIIIAIVNLVELAAKWNEEALQHTELYRRFSDLQARIVRPENHASEILHQLQAEAALIRKDEPPTMWAVYATCWNQVMERHYGADALRYSRKISRAQYFLRNRLSFLPKDFPQYSKSSAAI